MKKYFRALMMSMTMFCAVPCPFHKWDDEARPLMTLFLPAVGVWIGGLWTLLAFIVNLWLPLPALVSGALLCAFPFIITGGIHIDGFLDVVDAVKSWRDLEERRRILKDPHVGSFAVVFAILLIMAQFALLSTASPTEWKSYFTLMLTAVVSRCVAAIFVTVLRPMTTSEYAGAYRKGIKKSHVAILIIILAASVAAGFVFLGRYGFAAVAVIVGYLLALIRGFRSLGGMSGDISGFALTIAELCGIAVYALI